MIAGYHAVPSTGVEAEPRLWCPLVALRQSRICGTLSIAAEAELHALWCPLMDRGRAACPAVPSTENEAEARLRCPLLS